MNHAKDALKLLLLCTIKEIVQSVNLPAATTRKTHKLLIKNLMVHIKVVEEENKEMKKTMKTCFEQLSTGKLKVWRCQLVGSVKLPPAR